MRQLLAHLRTLGTPSIYRKHASLYFQGEVPQFLVYVLDGVVKAYTINAEGEETIVSLYGKGSVLPLAWVNGQAPTALFNYEAVNDVRVLKVHKSDFEAALETPEFMREYIDFLASSQASLLLRVTGLTQSRATEKICYTLYYLMFRYGIEREDGMYEIDLKLTQGMLANLIGQTRESTAKNLKQLKESGIIDYTSSTYRVSKKKLENFLGEDTFRNLEI